MNNSDNTMHYSKKNINGNAQVYENAVILPQKLTEGGPMWGLGGVCDKENQFVPISFYDGGWAKHGGWYDWDEEEYLDEDVVYIGMFYRHWGHFLVDLTNRMWYARKLAEEGRAFRVAYLGDEVPAGNNLRFLELLGIREEQLLHITRPTRCRKVYVPEQAFKSCDWYTDEFIAMLDQLVSKAIDGKTFPSLEKLKKIYFTRRSFSKAVSSEFGEEYFESCFLENGYTAIAPETLSVEEQIFLWNHAEEIVCMNGTIPLNVVFSRNPALHVIILNKTSIFHENPYILYEMRGVQATYLNIYKEPVKGYPKSLGEGPYLLWPTEEFDRFCRERGFARHMTVQERNKLFHRQFLKYCWYIIGLKRRLRLVLYHAVPEPLKKARRKLMSGRS